MPWKYPYAPKVHRRVLALRKNLRLRASAKGVCGSCLSRRSANGPGSRCAKCRKQRRSYYARNRKKIILISAANQKKNRLQRRKYLRLYMRKVRARVVKHLGDKCKRCGFSDSRALQIDHVNNDGWKELRAGRFYLGSYSFYLKVMADKKGRYQLLCANCNWIKHRENTFRI